MSNFQYRHYLRLDKTTEAALDELCRHLFTTKSELMRRFVREGIQRSTKEYAEEAEKLSSSISMLKRF